MLYINSLCFNRWSIFSFRIIWPRLLVLPTLKLMWMEEILCFPDGHSLFDSTIKECGLVHVKLRWADFLWICFIWLRNHPVQVKTTASSNSIIPFEKKHQLSVEPLAGLLSASVMTVNGLNWMEMFLLICAGEELWQFTTRLLVGQADIHRNITSFLFNCRL